MLACTWQGCGGRDRIELLTWPQARHVILHFLIEISLYRKREKNVKGVLNVEATVSLGDSGDMSGEEKEWQLLKVQAEHT